MASAGARFRPVNLAQCALEAFQTLDDPINATLKKELVNRRSSPSRLELQSAVFEYIEAFCNLQRWHASLNMLSPANYEQLRLSPQGG
jgi:transposase InsO family protein